MDKLTPEEVRFLGIGGWYKEGSSLIAPPPLAGYHYNHDQALEARSAGQILALRIETSRACNLQCKYCDNESGAPLEDELSFEEITDVVDQACSLGAQSIVIIGGGEPTIYPHFQELVQKISDRQMIPVIFTNCQTMTPKLAEFLHQQGSTVIVKLDSLLEQIQDDMVGKPGTHKKIMEGLETLQKAGDWHTYDHGPARLGVSMVVNKSNMLDIPNLWRYCREHGLVPNLEMMVANGKGKQENLMLSPAEWKYLKLQLLRVDQEHGYTWLPYTPLAGYNCFQCMYNLYVAVDGSVRPCSSIHENPPAANIRKATLAQIFEIGYFRDARYAEQHLQGKCGTCHHECLGCRGLAKSVHGDMFAEDPSCFRSEA